RALFRANREAVWKSFIGAFHRNGSDREHRVWIDATDIGTQQIRFFDRKIRRNDRGQPFRLSQLLIDLAREIGPFDIYIARLFAPPKLGDASRIVNVLPAVASFVAHPPLVDVRVFARLEAIDAVLILLNLDRAAGGAVGTDVVVAPHEPDPLLIEK